MHNSNNIEKEHNKTVVFVNGEKHDLNSNHVQVRTLIELGGRKPEEYDLEKRDGAKGPVIETFTNPDQVIEIKNGDDSIS